MTYSMYTVYLCEGLHIHMHPFRTMQGGSCGNQAYIQNWH